MVRKDDLVVNITFAWEHAIAVATSADDGLLVSHRFPTYRADGLSDIQFLKFLVSRKNFRNALELISPGGAGRNRVLDKGAFLSLTVSVPSTIPEQAQIGNLFDKLDEIIALHQRKRELLKQQKQVFLKQMFPPLGSTTPRLRFRGFVEPWSERKLDDLFRYEQPEPFIVQDTEYNDDHPVPVLTAGQSFILGYTDENNGIYPSNVEYPVVIFDDFTTNSHYVNFPFKVKSSAIKLLTLKNPKDDFSFCYSILKNIAFEPQNHERHWISKYSMFSVFVPGWDEQAKIGSLLRKLDELIAAESDRITNFGTLKQALLQKMFI